MNAHKKVIILSASLIDKGAEIFRADLEFRGLTADKKSEKFAQAFKDIKDRIDCEANEVDKLWVAIGKKGGHTCFRSAVTENKSQARLIVKLHQYEADQQDAVRYSLSRIKCA